MAETYDAAARLAEGQPAVENLQNYVWASHMVGYQHPDLTAHPMQVRDWYGTEDGLDLRALDADSAALRAVAMVTEVALERQDQLLAEMSTTWRGLGAEASRTFLRGHGDASALAASAIRNAAVTLADLRDSLWRAVDEKVATVRSIDDRVQAQRADWLPAAHAVTTGTGDLATASEMIDQEVKPFVDEAIRAELLTALRAAIGAMTAAYDAAAVELGSDTDAIFDVPGDLGPRWQPPIDDMGSTPAAASTAPAAAATPHAWNPLPAAASAPPPVAAAPPFASAPPVMPAPPPTTPAADPAALTPAMAPPSVPSLGGGLPDIGSGLSGLGQQLGEMIGGLAGTADDALSEPADLDMTDPDDPDDIENPSEEDEADELDDADEADGADGLNGEGEEAEALDAETDGSGGLEPPCEPAQEEPPAEPMAVTDAPPDVPVNAPPVSVEPPPPAVAPPPPPPAGTPCEIAADELPQVGA